MIKYKIIPDPIEELTIEEIAYQRERLARVGQWLNGEWWVPVRREAEIAAKRIRREGYEIIEQADYREVRK